MAILALTALLALAAAPASADTRINGSSAEGVAVSKQSGDIYVTNSQRIEEFHPDGTFVRAFGWGVLNGAAELQTCTIACQSGLEGSGPGQLSGSDELAVDNDEASSSYGDIYVVDQRNLRVEKFSASGEFLLMFGGEVDKTTQADVCTKGDVEISHDTCGEGVSGTTPSHFYESTTKVFGSISEQSWRESGNNSIAVAPDGIVYVGDFRRIQKFESDGTYIGDLTLPEAQFVSSLAVDASSHVYANSLALNERQKVNLPTSGTYELCFKSACTAPLAFDASEAEIRVAMEGLSTIGQGNVNIELYSFIQVSFLGTLGNANLPQITVSAGSVETLREGASGELVKLGVSGEILQLIDESGEPNHVALDSAGNLFVSDQNGSHVEPEPTGDFEFQAYRPDGTLYAVFTSDQVTGQFRSEPGGIALDAAAGVLYATAFNPRPNHIAIIPLPTNGSPTVTGEHVSDIQPTTATLHGVVNPRGFDTEYHFEYVDQKSFEDEGGFSSPNVHSTTTFDLGAINRDDPVLASISDLTPGVAYHYRIVAESAEGTVFGSDEFETLAPVSVRDFTTQTVGPELVTLKAELNPNGGSGTTYTIHYGEDTNYSGGASQGNLAIGNDFKEVTATFTHLQPNTTFHYQLIAENSYGEVETVDQTVTTELSAAEERANESCPNPNLREENNSLALADCRAYEQVSPTEKFGYPVSGTNWLAPSADRVAFNSIGIFADGDSSLIFNYYVAHRTSEGWITRFATRRPAEHDYQPDTFEEFDTELSRSLFGASPGLTRAEAEENNPRKTFFFGNADGSFVKATPTLNVQSGEPATRVGDVIAQSADLSHLFVASGYRLLPTDPVSPPNSGNYPGDRIYEVTGAGGPDPTMELVAALPPGLTNHNCTLDSSFGQRTTQSSADGSILFYDAPLELSPGEPCETSLSSEAPNKIALFAHIGGGPSIQISTPPASQCHPPNPCASSAISSAHFYGASPDGSRAWFTTKQSLIDSDGDSTEDLYFAKLENGQVAELVQASHGDATDLTPGKDAGVQGVVALSADGARAYFVATGVLTTDPNPTTHQTAAQGAENLYAYDASSGATKFVARLCSDKETSGSVADSACPADLEPHDNDLEGAEKRNDGFLWHFGEGTGRQAHVTPDGRYLIFKSFGRLTADDTDNAADIYRYDLQSGQLLRLSFGRNGNDGNGNDSAYNAEISPQGEFAVSSTAFEAAGAEDGSRSISADGSIVLFETPAPLVSHDTNTGSHPGCESTSTGCDVYEWEQAGHGTCAQASGCISLVSDGLELHGTNHGVVSSSGRDITVATNRSLVPADTDGVRDIYDARVDGGFHASHPPSPCGSPDACRSALTGGPSAPALGSETFVGPGNSKEHLKCAKGKRRVVRHGQVRCVPNPHRKHHKRSHRRAANTSPKGTK